jgi:hypothetical protein
MAKTKLPALIAAVQAAAEAERGSEQWLGLFNQLCAYAGAHLDEVAGLTPAEKGQFTDVLDAPLVDLNRDWESPAVVPGLSGIDLLRSLPVPMLQLLLSRGAIVSERIRAEAQKLIDADSKPS